MHRLASWHVLRKAVQQTKPNIAGLLHQATLRRALDAPLGNHWKKPKQLLKVVNQPETPNSFNCTSLI